MHRSKAVVQCPLHGQLPSSADESAVEGRADVACQELSGLFLATRRHSEHFALGSESVKFVDA